MLPYEEGLIKDRIIFDELIPGGAKWSTVVKKGALLRVIDLHKSKGVSMLCYNAANPTERYNAPDTMKIQGNIFVTKGMVLYSDMGRVLFSVIEDTAGVHDTLGGCSNALSNEKKYGKNVYYRNARDNFIIALGKYGLGKKDIVGNLNLFSKVTVDAKGGLIYHPNVSKASTFIEFRAEMDTLVILSNTPHPLDPEPKYDPKDIRAIVWNPVTSESDSFRDGATPETIRGLENNEEYLRAK